MSKLDKPTTGQMYRLAQYKSLLKSAEEEFNKYAAYTEIEIRNWHEQRRNWQSNRQRVPCQFRVSDAAAD